MLLVRRFFFFLGVVFCNMIFFIKVFELGKKQKDRYDVLNNTLSSECNAFDIYTLFLV